MENMKMLEFTIVANTPKPVLHLQIGVGPTTRLFAQLITGDPNAKSTSRVQVATQEFKNRLPLLDVIGERAYAFKVFFQQIPTGNHFLVLSGHIDDRIQLFIYEKGLAHLDGTVHEDPFMERITPFLHNHYEVRTFEGHERINIGVFDKSKRVCRFCGRSMPEVKFRQKAHAISESLGNKGLVCREECDECNKHFNETIEQDIINFFHFQLILHGVKGKNGDPTLKGDEISITNDTSSQETLGRDTLILKVKDMPDTRDPQKIAQFLSQQFSFSSVKFKPQNIYKCFCKYVLSLIDSKYLPYFQETINWINGPISKRRLPPVWHYDVPMSTTPSLVIMQRKHNHKEIPYCWAILNVASSQFLFILPFCSLDKYKFVGKSRTQFFLDGLKILMPNIELSPTRLDGTEPQSVKIDAHFDIPSDCVEGRDYLIAAD